MNITAVKQLVEKARRIQHSQQLARSRSRAKTEEIYEAGCQLVGGAIGGLVDGYLGDGADHEVWGVPTVLTGGALLTVIGLADLVPGASYVASVGLGATAYGLGNLVREKSASE